MVFNMKKLGRKSVIAGMLAAVLCFAGCGGSSSDTAATEAAAESGYYDSGDIYEQEYKMEEAAEGAAEGSDTSVTSNRKLIKNVYMDVETEEFDKLVPRIENKVEALGGYIENMNLYNGSSAYEDYNRSADMTIRIPKDRLDEFVSEVAEISNVVSKNESVEDITLQYVDLESHKKALETEQERLLALLEQAETMEDIIAIEERLSQVRYELESMESQLRTYDNLVDFSTVNISISEVERLTPVEEISDMQRMTQGFVRSVGNLLQGIKNFFIGLVICLPYLLFLALIIFAIVRLVRMLIKRNEKKALKQTMMRNGNGNYGAYVPGQPNKSRQPDTDNHQEPK